jgi:hypothetical protein
MSFIALFGVGLENLNLCMGWSCGHDMFLKTIVVCLYKSYYGLYEPYLIYVVSYIVMCLLSSIFCDM